MGPRGMFSAGFRVRHTACHKTEQHDVRANARIPATEILSAEIDVPSRPQPASAPLDDIDLAPEPATPSASAASWKTSQN